MADFGGMSADQINASMGFGPGGVGDQSQAFINSMYGPQGFGSSTYGMVGGYPSFGEPSGPGSVHGPDPNDPANIALYYQLMGRGGGTGYDYGSLYQPPATVNDRFSQLPGQPYYPGYADNTFGAANAQQSAAAASPDADLVATYYRLMYGIGAPSQQQQIQTPPAGPAPSQPVSQDWNSYFNGFNAPPSQQRDSIATALMTQPPQTSMNNPSSQALLGYTPSYLPGGSLNQNDPGNIAEYYRLMGGGGGVSNAPAYQGNPYYLPDPMQGQQSISQGGGLGAPGFGPYGGSSYSGQPGYGLAIGSVGGPNVGETFGTSGGGPMYGYGGLTEQGGGDMGARFSQLMQQGGAGAVQADPQLQAEYYRLMGAK
jgi:hypothetical protein